MISLKARERFLKLYAINDDGCWIVNGQPSNRYHMVMLDGKKYLAHRASFIIHFGRIPTNKMICHHCDVMKCINPEHLYAGTSLDNNRDRTKRGRDFNGTKTECKNGHPILVEGVDYYLHKRSGGFTRYCLQCRRNNDKNRKRNTDAKAHAKYLAAHRIYQNEKNKKLRLGGAKSSR